jgi:hypothetical protein
VGIDDQLAQVKAETVAAGVAQARVVGPVKRFRQARYLRRRHADTAVADLDDGGAIFDIETDIDRLAAGGGVLAGIVEQIFH